MTDRRQLSRRAFLTASSAATLGAAAVGLPRPAAAAVSPGAEPALRNGRIEASFGDRGLTAIRDVVLGHTIGLAGDRFTLDIDGAHLDGGQLTVTERRADTHSVSYRYISGPYTVDAVYELQPGWAFVSKALVVRVTGAAAYRIQSVQPLLASVGQPIESELPVRGGSYGVFLRFGGYGAFVTVQNPFLQWNRNGTGFSAGYQPDLDWQPAYGPFTTDRVLVGTYLLTGHSIPTQMVPQWQYLPDPGQAGAGSPMMDLAEWQAMTDCVAAFMLAPATPVRRVHVPWCENDFQIDVSAPGGMPEWQRIVDRAVSVGCRDMLCTPSDSAVLGPGQDSDDWGWEHITWLALSRQIRQGTWDPATDPIPAQVQALLDYARSKGIGLMAYVYPSIPYRQQWTVPGGHYTDSGIRDYQDWLLNNLITFARRTGISGFSFDYWWLNLPGGTSTYQQWHGCRRILQTLREQLPDVVIDGRQDYQNWGPWTWLAGSYPHPTGNDEQPESFRAFPDLHTDRVSANHERWAAWWYRTQNFCPTELAPGFMTHQTERYQPDGELRRDWDYLGWKYSVISSIGVAPLNNVVNMIPARDPDEFAAFSPGDAAWFRRWLDFTDQNREVLSAMRPIISQPMIGAVDGTAAIRDDHGFVFLFNPNHRMLDAEFTLDTAIGLTAPGTYLLREHHPREGLLIGKPGTGTWSAGDTITVPMAGAEARVLEVIPYSGGSQPLLFGATGTVTLTGQTAAASDAAGPAGHTVPVSVLLPNTRRIDALTVNGHSVPFTRTGNLLTTQARFAGTAFDHDQQLGKYDPAFTGGTVSANFTVPARIADQLRSRQQAWPVAYTPQELEATWLGPQRLLLFVNIAEPSDGMPVSMMLDGQPVTLNKAYNSIYPNDPGQTFLGWYTDISSLTLDTPHTVSVTIPPTQPGQFQGLFVQNVETEYTTALASQ